MAAFAAMPEFGAADILPFGAAVFTLKRCTFCFHLAVAGSVCADADGICTAGSVLVINAFFCFAMNVEGWVRRGLIDRILRHSAAVLYVDKIGAVGLGACTGTRAAHHDIRPAAEIILVVSTIVYFTMQIRHITAPRF